MRLRFVAGRPVSAETTACLAWCSALGGSGEVRRVADLGEGLAVHQLRGPDVAAAAQAQSQADGAGGRVMQFSGLAPVSLFPPPRRGRARVGVKAGGVPRPCFSPPSQPSPARGEGAEGPGRRGENRKLHDPGQGVRLLACRLPRKSPWLNPIEPKWVHGKRASVEPDRLLRNLSCAACPDRTGPRCTLLRVAVAGCRSARVRFLIRASLHSLTHSRNAARADSHRQF